MKRIFLVFVTAMGFMACADNANNENGTGGSIDSAYMAPSTDNSTAPSTDNPTDNTTVSPDTSTLDHGNRGVIGDTTMRKTGTDKRPEDASGK